MTHDLARRGFLGTTAALAALAAHPLAASVRARREEVSLPVAGRTATVTHWRAPSSRGTILFSHGAQSSPLKYDPIILPWVAAGYDVWAPLHVDSTDHPDTRAYVGLASWRARIEDMRALAAHVGGGPLIAAGHSYGALTALTLGGVKAEVPEGITGPLAEPRVKAVVAFSPPGPIKGLVSNEGYSGLGVPALIQTGDRDLPPGGPAAPADAWKAHLAAFESAAPGGDRYALVLAGADHFFGGLICWLDRPGPPQTAQIRTASEVSRLFLDAHAGGSARARRVLDARLRDDGPVILRRR